MQSLVPAAALHFAIALESAADCERMSHDPPCLPLLGEIAIAP